jgi:hypothetical protein
MPWASPALATRQFHLDQDTTLSAKAEKKTVQQLLKEPGFE